MKKFLGFIVLSAIMIMEVQAQLPTGFNSTAATNESDNWDEPVGAAFSKDGQRLFIWEKGGRVWVNNRRSSDGLHLKQLVPVIDISDEVGNWSDMGLLGFALDPGYSAAGGYIYLYYVVDRHHLLTNGNPANGYNASHNTYFAATIGRITRYTTSMVAGNLVADKATRKVLLGESITTGIPLLHKSHSVGTLAFAADGTLLVTSGDGASYDDTDAGEQTNDDPNIHNNTYHVDALADGIITREENVGAFRSQMLNSLNGKLLRLDPETGDGMPSNPFFDAGAPRSAKSRVWALGLRNPFRMSIKPNSGSTNPSEGHLGEIFIGDVGFGQAEELNIVTKPGQNFGWPIYEGTIASSGPGAPQTSYWGYPHLKNREELRPLCDNRDTMFFHELLRQDNEAKNTEIYSDCSGDVVKSGIRFIHQRPALEWAHVDGQVYVPRFDAGGNAIPVIVGTPESNVTANNTFAGNASTGGIWLTGGANPTFPPEYRNVLMVSDFGGRWIRRVGIDFSDVVTSVDDFFINSFVNGQGGGEGAVVSMAENPIDGSLVYVAVGLVAYGSQTAVRKIVFGGNVPPVAKIGADKHFSADPNLTVNFTGNTSFDQDGTINTYSWDFGDPDSGTDNFSNAANPTHIFTTAGTAPKTYVVKLTVTDDDNFDSEEVEYIVSLNNIPPVVDITSPINDSKYKIGPDTVYALTADVTDDPTQALTYSWQTSLIHNNHSHSNPIDHAVQSSAVIERIGCSGQDTYHWLITLKVTDDAGLSASDTSQIYPNCSTTLPLILRSFSVTQKSTANVIKWTTDLESNIEYFEVERSYDGVSFLPINKQDARNDPGTSNYNYSDNSFSPGIVYYRLKMVEHGNIIRYSVIVRTMSGADNTQLRIVPNPVVANFSVIYNSLQDDNVTIQITDIAGRVIHTLREKVNNGQNVIYLQNLPSWPAGVYFLSVQGKNDIKREKFVKTR